MTDTYRVIYTRADGFVIPGTRKSRDEALAYFDGVMASSPKFPPGARLAVMSDHEWRKVRPLGGAG